MATARTVLQIIEAALRKIGVYSPEEAPLAADTTTALIALQDMLSEWSDGGLTVPITVQETFNLIVGTAAYTVGQTGAPSLNTVRPEQVMGAFVRDSGGNDFPVKIAGEREYRRIETKAAVGRPECVYVYYGSPNLTMYMHPVPDSIEAFYFSSRKNLTEPTTLVQDMFTAVQIPRNFHTALVWNLAMEITEEYGKPPTQLMVKRAMETKNNVISMNAARTHEAVRLDLIPEREESNTSSDYL